MIEIDERWHVVGLTLQWLNTPYVHQGRIKGLAADCTFFAKVFEEAGLIPEVPIPFYSAQAHINRGACVYLSILTQYAKREITQAETQIGDVVMYNVARTFSHGAVIVDPGWPAIVHADMLAKRVQRADGMSSRLANREKRFFSFW